MLFVPECVRGVTQHLCLHTCSLNVQHTADIHMTYTRITALVRFAVECPPPTPSLTRRSTTTSMMPGLDCSTSAWSHGSHSSHTGECVGHASWCQLNNRWPAEGAAGGHEMRRAVDVLPSFVVVPHTHTDLPLTHAVCYPFVCCWCRPCSITAVCLPGFASSTGPPRLTTGAATRQTLDSGRALRRAAQR